MSRSFNDCGSTHRCSCDASKQTVGPDPRERTRVYTRSMVRLKRGLEVQLVLLVVSCGSQAQLERGPANQAELEPIVDREDPCPQFPIECYRNDYGAFIDYDGCPDLSLDFVFVPQAAQLTTVQERLLGSLAQDVGRLDDGVLIHVTSVRREGETEALQELRAEHIASALGAPGRVVLESSTVLGEDPSVFLRLSGCVYGR